MENCKGKIYIDSANDDTSNIKEEKRRSIKFSIAAIVKRIDDNEEIEKM